MSDNELANSLLGSKRKEQKMMTLNQKSLLGIFDSGIGGFSVLREVRHKTNADIVYFGDCARAPYGNRSEEEIVKFIKEIVLSLKEEGVTHFVSACNSMSVLTTKKLLDEVGIAKERYVDMVDAVQSISLPLTANVLILGTQATISSGKYQTILKEKKIPFAIFAPLTLAGDIERGDARAISVAVEEIMARALQIQATHILYACTHYPLEDIRFKEEALRVGWFGIFIDPAVYIADEMVKFGLGGNASTTYTTSLETDIFKEYSEKTW